MVEWRESLLMVTRRLHTWITSLLKYGFFFCPLQSVTGFLFFSVMCWLHRCILAAYVKDFIFTSGRNISIPGILLLRNQYKSYIYKFTGMYMYWQQINPTLQCSSLQFAVWMTQQPQGEVSSVLFMNQNLMFSYISN